MTNEEYVKWLKQLDENLKFDGLIDGDKEVDLHEMIFNLCEMLEQQTCEDAVSREAVLGLFAKNADAVRPYSKTWKEVKALPSVNPQYTEDEIQKMQDLEQAEIQKTYELGKTEGQKTGHWIMPVNDDGMSDPYDYQVKCSECGFDLDPQTWHQELHQYGADKFCPKCGAKMVERSEE